MKSDCQKRQNRQFIYFRSVSSTFCTAFMFDDGTYKYFTAVSVLISIIYQMNTCYKLARIQGKGKTLMCLLPYRASFFAAEYFNCNRACYPHHFTDKPCQIYITDAKFSISNCLIIKMMTKKKKNKSDLKPKSWNRIQHSSNI